MECHSLIEKKDKEPPFYGGSFLSENLISDSMRQFIFGLVSMFLPVLLLVITGALFVCCFLPKFML